MRTFVGMLVALCVAIVSPAYAGGEPEKTESSGWAAIAFSTNPHKPDGWGAESAKDTKEGAVAAAVGYCEDNLKKKGIAPAQCKEVLFHSHWVVGIVCHEPGRVWHGLGAGETPVDATSMALSKLGDAPAKRCGTTLVRSGMYGWRDWHPTVWRIRLSCGRGSTTGSDLKGFTALTRAILDCRDTRASTIRVVKAEHD